MRWQTRCLTAEPLRLLVRDAEATDNDDTHWLEGGETVTDVCDVAPKSFCRPLGTRSATGDVRDGSPEEESSSAIA